MRGLLLLTNTSRKRKVKEFLGILFNKALPAWETVTPVEKNTRVFRIGNRKLLFFRKDNKLYATFNSVKSFISPRSIEKHLGPIKNLRVMKVSKVSQYVISHSQIVELLSEGKSRDCDNLATSFLKAREELFNLVYEERPKFKMIV